MAVMANTDADDTNPATLTLLHKGPFEVLRLIPGVYQPDEIKRYNIVLNEQHILQHSTYFSVPGIRHVVLPVVLYMIVRRSSMRVFALALLKAFL